LGAEPRAPPGPDHRPNWERSLEYDEEALWIAAHKHDWGACPRWFREAVSHSLKSKALAQRYLRKARYPSERTARVLEAIEFHHGGREGRCLEAVLLSDADALDSLGIVGVLREFAMLPCEYRGGYSFPAVLGLRDAYEGVQIRNENSFQMLRLETSRTLARRRIKAMDCLLAQLEAETAGCF
jgi:HD superfamily phosphodiesterase